MKGHVYRLSPVTASQLIALIQQYVSLPCWSFGGASLWDLDPNVPSLRALSYSDQINVSGDFGHAFSKQAEVRWKRLSQETLDVLILSEQPLNISGAQVLGTDWEVRDHPSRPLLQSGQRPRIIYYSYHAPNGAAQFIRYLEGETR